MRLTTQQLKIARKKLLARQNGIDPITGWAVKEENAVLDHSHVTGFVRAVLGRWNNGVLGKIENWAGRLGADPATGQRLTTWEYLRRIADYLELHSVSQHNGLLHSTHRTEREKKDLANARARKARREAAKAKRQHAEATEDSTAGH